MNAIVSHLTFLRGSLFHPSFWLVVIGLCLAGLHLSLESQYGTDGYTTLSLLFWLITGYLLRKKLRQNGSDVLSTGVGGFIVGFSALAALSVTRYPLQLTPLHLFPFFSGLGWALLAAGWRGWHVYRQELGLLLFLGLPQVFFRSLPLDMTIVTAKFATFGLWYTGFDVTRTGDVIRLPTGSIFVFPDCSGVQTISNLWSLAILIGTVLTFPLIWNSLLSVCAILIGFVINGIRVMLLAILVAGDNDIQFKFWHEGSGSLIFSMAGALVLGAISYWFVRLTEPPAFSLHDSDLP